MGRLGEVLLHVLDEATSDSLPFFCTGKGSPGEALQRQSPGRGQGTISKSLLGSGFMSTEDWEI